MGLVIEKQKNKDEGEEKNDDGKIYDKGKRKRRKRDQSKHDAKLKKVQDNDDKSDKKKRPVETSISTDDKSNCSEGQKSLALSGEVNGSEFTEKELDSSTHNEEEKINEEGRTNNGERITLDKTLTEQRNSSHVEKRKDCICDLCCCLGIMKDVDDFQDGQENGDENDEDEENEDEGEEDADVDISKDTDETVSLKQVIDAEILNVEVTKQTCPSQLEIKDSVTGDEFPVETLFDIHRPKGKNYRYQSSRPTSLETIIEDVTSSHFSSQDSIKKTFDGREDHRGGREHLNYFQEKHEGEEQEEEEEEEGEERAGESTDDNINSRPLSSSKIFRGVIENLNFILDYEDNNGCDSSNQGLLPDLQVSEEVRLDQNQDVVFYGSSKVDPESEDRHVDIVVKENDGDEERHSPSPGTQSVLPLSITQEELASMMEKFVQYHHPFARRIAQERSEIESPTITSVEVNQCTQDHPPSYPQTEEEKENILTSFSTSSDLGCESPQVEKEESLERRIYFPADVTEGSVIEKRGIEGNVVPATSLCIDGNDSEGCNIGEGVAATGSSFDEQDRESGACHLNAEKVKGTDDKGVDDANTQSEIAAQETLPTERVVQGSLHITCDADGSGNKSEFKQGVVIEPNNVPCTSSRVQGEYLDPSGVFVDNGQEKEEVSCHKTVTELSETVVDIKKSVSSAVENTGDEPQRKVSFTVFIQYESINSEIVQTESIDDLGATTDSVVASNEIVDPIVGEEEENPEDNEALDYSVEKEYQLKILKAIQSLDSLNDQIVEFIFSGAEFEEDHGGTPKQREALKSSMSLMRRLLVDAQSKFRKMVEDNKQLASRIDGELQTAHQEVNLLRQELADTNRRITEIQEHNNHHHQQQQQQQSFHHQHHSSNMEDIHRQEGEGGGGSGVESPLDSPTPATINGPSKYHSESSGNQLAEEMSQLRLENEKLSARNRSLQREVEELRRVKESMVEEDLQLKPQINQMTMELTHAKEALSALKADRKRLKAEKFDLLNQMKQLYATLEDKEKELRDFIRNYEQRMKESDESLRCLAAERDETEREKWNILKHARDESEKVVKLSAQLGLKDTALKKLQEELDVVRKQLTSVGYYSDAESVRTNGLPTPTASTPTCSPQPISTPTPTPNGRGSSADSGVRLSSDRDSTASHDGGVGTPKESPSLSPLYATPSSIRGDDRTGDNTPTGPTPSLNSSAMSGLASSSGGLSRSAEQLCERLAEGGDASKVRGSSTLSRKSNKSGGTWGSISRVFARQKKRAALDASLYDGNGSDKRASWSPSSSLCVSPLTEESYSEKLRLLEEAQHIPLERWKAPTVLAWLEVTLGMPQYGAMCAENVRSGKVLLELSDSELEAGLGISHPMHRKKLRLAIEELREPRLSRFPRISTLGHIWVSSEWLPDLGLPHYCDAFANNLVDGRLLEALTKKELEKHLGVHRKFHQASIIHGVHLLRIVRFDRQILAERRRQCEHVDCDPIVWTNIRWVKWARSIDLAEYADNLKDSGVHGALVVLESSFTSDTMATALGIPQSKNIIRRHLATELESLVNPARQQLDEQARFAKLERRRQEKLAAGGSLGRSFSRSYGTGLEKAEKDKRRASLRGSLSRALGLRVREEINAAVNNGGESSSSGGQSPAVSARAHPHHPPQARPRSSIMPSGVYIHHETHRRVKSIGDIETITVTPV